LTLEDAMPGGELRIRHGKGNKQRTIYLESGAQAALAAWMAVRGLGPGPLFVAINKSGVISAAPLCGQAVERILRKRAGEGAVAKFTPHDLRRSCFSDLLDAGADLVAVQAIAGHSSPSTTAGRSGGPAARPVHSVNPDRA
jgi:integrase